MSGRSGALKATGAEKMAAKQKTKNKKRNFNGSILLIGAGECLRYRIRLVKTCEKIRPSRDRSPLISDYFGASVTLSTILPRV
jgi:hypothetical protein